MSKHSIRLPGLILDELKSKDYTDDGRFATVANPKKRRQTTSRKAKRKQERLDKKHKKSNVSLQSSFKRPEGIAKRRQDGKSTNSINSKSTSKRSDLPFSSDDELSSGDFDTFDDQDLVDAEKEQLREMDAEEGMVEMDEISDSDSEPMTVQETMAKLKAMKKAKTASRGRASDEEEIDEPMTAEETMARLRALKEAKVKRGKEFCEDSQNNSASDCEGIDDEFHGFDDDPVEQSPKSSNIKQVQRDSKKSVKTKVEETKTKKVKKREYNPVTQSELAAIKRDEMDMQYYAKKLGLKRGSKKLRAVDEYDAVGGLLEGLDFFQNYTDGDGDGDEMGLNEESGSDGDEYDDDSNQSSDLDSSGEHLDDKNIENPFSSDDDLSSGDFDEFDDDDLDEEEWEQLRELEGSSASNSKPKRKKENPYVAPSQSSTYIPPSMRKSIVNGVESKSLLEVKKKVRSSLNKLTESNIPVIVSSLNELFDLYARHEVSNTLNSQIFEIISQESKLLDSFIMSYSSIAYAIWKLRGTEFGASFIQELVQLFMNLYNEQLSKCEDSKSMVVNVIPKQCSNLIVLLSYTYNFGIISSRLIYDVIKLLIQTPNEFTMELLLRIVAVSGTLIRGDDPTALKEIIIDLLLQVKSINQTPRIKFLLETMTDLKNNRLKPSVMSPSHQSLKKMLSGTLKGTSPDTTDSLQVTLFDIINVDTKGKWWLIGASWRGNMQDSVEETKIDDRALSKRNQTVNIDDGFLDDIPDWDRIAKQQRMNTAVRRAIFVSIMSAQDYMDAFAKLEKLNLKNRQSLEIPKVLVHCLSTDGASNGYNPYYSLVGLKLCEHNPSIFKSFQFLFWDIIKKFENDNVSSEEDNGDDDLLNFKGDLHDEMSLKKISSLACFFGCLLGEGKLRLDIFKHVNLMGGLGSDGLLFVENMLFQALITIAKKSEVKVKDGFSKKYIYKDDELRNHIIKGIQPDSKSAVLKSLKWCMAKKFKFKNYIRQEKGSREVERETRRLEWAVPCFLKFIDLELESVVS